MSLSEVTTFEELIPWLYDNLDWPLQKDDLDSSTQLDKSTFEYKPEELGLKDEQIARVREVREIRPFSINQNWRIYLINFEDKKIPISILKRILRWMTDRQRNNDNEPSWKLNDLMFIAHSGESGQRGFSFLHFAEDIQDNNKTVLRELGWDKLDRKIKVEYVEDKLKNNLRWPKNDSDIKEWPQMWKNAMSATYGNKISTAKSLSKVLASFAAAINESIKSVLDYEQEDGSITAVYRDFKNELFRDLDHDGFADMYAQTICSGLLSLNIHAHLNKRIDNKVSLNWVNHPHLNEIFSRFFKLGSSSKINFNDLGLAEVETELKSINFQNILLDFGRKKKNEDPVIFFYEYFLEEYDSIAKKKRGVYYTPAPVVRYILKSIDEKLKYEFGLEDGLADTSTWRDVLNKNPNFKKPNNINLDSHFVQILDPATGTGTFLVELIDIIAKKMNKKWVKQKKSPDEIFRLWNDYVPKHLLSRIHGFEIMMAPYVIAHLRINLLLQESGYIHSKKSPRIKIFLTNTLEEPNEYSGQQEISLVTRFMVEEIKNSSNIKLHTFFTVLIGNPPYSGHSQNPSKKEKRKLTFSGELIKDYFFLNGKRIKGNTKWLNDEYVKFIRYAELQILKTGVGVIGYVNNNAFLTNFTFSGMRKHLMNSFNNISIVNLQGRANLPNNTTELEKDECVFLITLGVSINIFSKNFVKIKSIHYIDKYGTKAAKFEFLKNLSPSSPQWILLTPSLRSYLYIPINLTYIAEYNQYVCLEKVFKKFRTGITTSQDKIAYQPNKKLLLDLANKLIESDNVEKVREELNLPKDKNNWKLASAVQDIIDSKPVNSKISKVHYRPFCEKFTFFTGNSGWLYAPRVSVMSHLSSENNFALISIKMHKIFGEDWCHVDAANCIVDNCAVSNETGERGYVFPLILQEIYQENLHLRPNITAGFIDRISSSTKLSFHFTENLDGYEFDSRFFRGDLVKTFGILNIFEYILGILHSNSYREKYADFFIDGFPRIPVPGSLACFSEISQIGCRLLCLRLLDESEIRKLSNPSFRFIGDNKFINPGYPKYENGKVLINKNAFFEDVTSDIWYYKVGSYQICKKWFEWFVGSNATVSQPAVLTDDTILKYRKILESIKLTLLTVPEIDSSINNLGGWRKAFALNDNQESLDFNL